MFNFIKEKLGKIYTSISSKLHDIFNKKSIDQATIQELNQLLIKADTGVVTTKKLIAQIEQGYKEGNITSGQDIANLIENEL